MKSYIDIKLSEFKVIDRNARKYLEEILSEHSRTYVESKLRVKSYSNFRNQREKDVNARCIQLLSEGFQ